MSDSHYPGLCIDDFNEIGARTEKEGAAAWRMTQIHYFLKLFSDCALMDLEFNGPLLLGLIINAEALTFGRG
ncbi:hypothetical protein ACSBR2_010793 [Camellia fascicularis]